MWEETGGEKFMLTRGVKFLQFRRRAARRLNDAAAQMAKQNHSKFKIAGSENVPFCKCSRIKKLVKSMIAFLKRFLSKTSENISRNSSSAISRSRSTLRKSPG